MAVADALSSEDLVRSIGEMKSTIARTLAQLADRLEEEIGKYGQIRRAIAAKDAELKEIYEIERSASTLLAIMETQQRQQEEMERDFQAEKEQLERDIAATRADWENERKQREQEIKERDAAEQKRRQREQEEYKYNFAREQQLAQDRSGDALAKGEKELSERKTQLEHEWAEREKALAAQEEQIAQLRARAAGFAAELKAAAEGAAAEAAARLEQQHRAADELLPPPGGGREERAGGEDRRPGTHRERPGRAAYPAGTAGREGRTRRCRKSPCERSKARPAPSSSHTFSNSWPTRPAKVVRSGSDGAGWHVAPGGTSLSLSEGRGAPARTTPFAEAQSVPPPAYRGGFQKSRRQNNHAAQPSTTDSKPSEVPTIQNGER